jgi:hypothetical protein
MKAVVVGTGRSGTGFMAALLSRSGMPCTHEGVYNPWGPMQRATEAESSWLAVPYLPVADKTILVFRGPADVVRSFLGIAFFTTESAYLDFALKHLPSLRDMDPQDAAEHWYREWNRRAAEHADLFVRLDDVQVGPLASLLDLDEERMAKAMRALPTKVNHRRRVPLQRPLRPETMDVYEELKSRTAGASIR